MTKKNNGKKIDDVSSCWGTYEKSKKCLKCIYEKSCREGKEDTERQKSQNIAWTGYREYDDAKKIAVVSDRRHAWRMPDGKIIEPSSINLELVIWALREGCENPNSARALALSLAGAKSLSEIAYINGRTRQAERKAIALELGVGKRKVSDSKLLELSEREFLVYQCFSRGYSYRKTARSLNLHLSQVVRCVHFLRSKGFDVCTHHKSGK